MAAQVEMTMPFGLSRFGRARMLMSKDTAEELSAPVEAYRESQESPPWDLSTLVVIGLVCCDGQGSLVDCFGHIVALFPCFRKAATTALFGLHEAPRFTVLRRFEDALCDYSIPIRAIDQPFSSLKDTIYSITREAAIQHLRKTIVAPKYCSRRLPQRLLDLPAELRNRIYEYVFVFSTTGLRITHSAKHAEVPRVITRTRSLEPIQFNKDLMSAWLLQGDFEDRLFGDEPLMVGTLPSLVSPSWLGKQVWQEAMPIFYGQNHFHCGNLKELHNLMSRTPNFSKHFRSVSVIYNSNDRMLGHKALKLLRQAPNLEHLAILIDVPIAVYKGFRSVETYKGLPGLWATLVKLNSLKSVKFYSSTDDMVKQVRIPFGLKICAH